MGDSHFLHTCILDNLTNLEMLFVHLQKVVDEYTLAGLLAHLFLSCYPPSVIFSLCACAVDLLSMYKRLQTWKLPGHKHWHLEAGRQGKWWKLLYVHHMEPWAPCFVSWLPCSLMNTGFWEEWRQIFFLDNGLKFRLHLPNGRTWLTIQRPTSSTN